MYKFVLQDTHTRVRFLAMKLPHPRDKEGQNQVFFYGWFEAFEGSSQSSGPNVYQGAFLSPRLPIPGQREPIPGLKSSRRRS